MLRNPIYTCQTLAKGKVSAAHKGMIHATKIIASTITPLIEDPSKLNKLKMLFMLLYPNTHMFLLFLKRFYHQHLIKIFNFLK